MRSPPRASTRRAGARGFTLIELLVVLAIIIIVAAIAIPSLGPVMGSYNLSRAGTMVADEMNFCRQTALTKNADVELRFYQVGSTTYTAGSPFTAFRAFLANASAPSQAVGLDKVSYLPGGVIISSATDALATSPVTTFSPLLESANTQLSGLSTGTDTLPGGTKVAYVSFLFRATGGTNLTPITSLWYVTLYLQNAPIVSHSLPANYFTVQVDPVDGQIRTYRP